ncbi:hypothetical protein HYDPIDRAFT_174145 [Hydnomerulius pinastri MD-312]|nr:hypothetical protein HYDPIDRAFT_174145 [Hydnomerulius pinastri MD-312]
MAPDSELWRPFVEQGDHKFAEITLEAGLNAAQVNSLLSLISHIAKGKAKVTFRNEVDLRRAWDCAAMQVTPFVQHNIIAPYKGEDFTFPVYARPLWDWALDLLSNPLLAPHFFYSEPWTGDQWWDIQSHLPEIENTVPFAFILYADCMRLSLHSTVKGYPVVAWCGNLPVDIRNGERYGGGCVVGWLPIVPEPAKEERKPGYTNYKRVVWHEAFLRILDKLAELSRLGYQHECYNKILRWLFPLILILSTDYEEQCMMCLNCGTNGKCPCPVCLVPLEELCDLAKTFLTCTVTQDKDALAVYKQKKSAGEPILKALGLRPVSIKALLGKLLRKFAAQLEEQLDKFSSWSGLVHFDGILHTSYTDGNKMRDLAKLIWVLRSYLEVDSLVGLDVHTDRALAMIESELLVFSNKLKDYISCVQNGELADSLKTDWDFPKAHLWEHVMRDIQNKGVACNYSTCPNEKMHGPLKDAYRDRSNGKDVAVQVLCVDHHHLARKFIRARINAEDERAQSAAKDPDSDDDTVQSSFEGLIKLGAPRKPQSIASITADHASDPECRGFHQKFTAFINQCLPLYLNQDPGTWNNISFPETFELREHAYLKVNYESKMDWRKYTNHLRCNPSFHSKPRYDCVLFQFSQDEIPFARLMFMFTCKIPEFGEYDFALVHPYTAELSAARKLSDMDLRITCIKARLHLASVFIPIWSVIRGALLYPDPQHKHEYFVVEHIDGDMFLRIKEWNQQRQLP